MRMSRQVRYRVMAVALGGLLVGAPLLTSGTAEAAVAQSGPRVIFGGGGWPGFSCRSSPDVESMRVPAASTVLVVNRTGHDGRLLLGGTDRGLIRQDGATLVRFQHGTTSVLIDPNCSLGNAAGSAMVSTDSPDPTDSGPSPDGTDSAPPDDDPAWAQEPFVDSGPVGPAPDAPTSAAQHAPATISHGGGARPGRARRGAGTVTAKKALPPRAVLPKIKVKAPARTPGAVVSPVTVAPVGSGATPGVRKGEVPPVATPVPAARVVPPARVAAAEPVATMRPLPPERPIGLLALVAAVCAVGVGVAAIRAFVSERAYGARIT
jgi:hypothetical protein